jgi:hypothetical protein
MQVLVIYPSDVSFILNRSASYGRRVIRDIKKELGKSKKQYVTRKEFADYFNFTYQEVEEALNKRIS